MSDYSLSIRSLPKRQLMQCNVCGLVFSGDGHDCPGRPTDPHKEQLDRIEAMLVKLTDGAQ